MKSVPKLLELLDRFQVKVKKVHLLSILNYLKVRLDMGWDNLGLGTRELKWNQAIISFLNVNQQQISDVE